MNTLELLRDGFANALTWAHLAWAFAGVTLGTAVGVLPGIGPALTVALLLPITFNLDPISAFIMFGGIYYGAMYGGSTTSILLNTPGETASIATAIDGYAMARQGRGAAALTTAAIGSFVAGTLATIALTFFSPLRRCLDPGSGGVVSDRRRSSGVRRRRSGRRQCRAVRGTDCA